MTMAAPSDDAHLPELAALQAVIAERREDDPLIGAKLGSELALNQLLHQLQTERGVHAETLMATAGVLIGQSLQASVWAEAEQAGQNSVAGLHLVRCQDDSCYFVGEPLNRKLLVGYDSPWQLLGEAAKQEGCERLPDGEQLLLEGIQRLCTSAFGRPQVPAAYTPAELAAAEQGDLWLRFGPFCNACCSDPAEWPLLFGLVAARALRMVTTHLSPELAFRLAMDAAIDAAKVPLAGHSMAGG
ncbi:MAG: hypothetical protein ACK5Q7_03030 [Cyanobacteriota bacterium]